MSSEIPGEIRGEIPGELSGEISDEMRTQQGNQTQGFSIRRFLRSFSPKMKSAADNITFRRLLK
jgi:hypothetical protein